MKIANIAMNQQFHQAIAPPIPMERPPPKNYSKTDSLTYKLKSTPGQADSATYKLTVPFFSTGSPEDIINFF